MSLGAITYRGTTRLLWMYFMVFLNQPWFAQTAIRFVYDYRMFIMIVVMMIAIVFLLFYCFINFTQVHCFPSRQGLV